MILPGTGRGTAAGGGGGVRQALRPEVLTARTLRRDMTLPEVLLWQRLRGGKAGAKIRRQHPIGPYIIDFYCNDARLAVEIDGAIHDGSTGRDATRDTFLRENGHQVLHINAGDILKSPDEAAASIVALVARPLHQPAAGPPPRAGEEL